MKGSLIFLSAVLALLSLQNAKAQQKYTGDKIIAVVGNSMILWSDLADAMNGLEEQRRLQGVTSDKDPQCEALEYLLMQKMLANQARLDSVDINYGMIQSMVDGRVTELIEQFGSMSELERIYRKRVYDIEDDLRLVLTDMHLAQRMEDEIKDDVLIVPSEVDRYFRGMSKDSLPMIPEQYVYAQIVMYPPSLEEAKFRARERLLDMRQRIINGDRFETLARLYSHDPGSAARGGEMDPQPKEAFVKPYGDAIATLRVGQISEVVETEFGFHIIELLGKSGSNYHTRHILIRPEYTLEEITETALRLDSVANRIRSGELTFERAALEYSQDDFSKYNGGVVTNHEIVQLYQAGAKYTSTRFNKEDLMYDHAALVALSPGEVSDSYQSYDLRGNQLVKIVMLKEVIPSHRANIREDYGIIEEMALADKQERVFQEWLRKKIAAMYIRIDPEFIGCDFENKGWVK